MFRWALVLQILWVSSSFAQIPIYNFTTIAGSTGTPGSTVGLGTSALFYSPTHLATDTNGNLFVADYGNSTIREILPVAGQWLVNTISGTAGTTGSVDNIGTSALFNNPMGIASSGSGNLFVTDYGNSTLRMIVPTTGSWSTYTIAGSAGTMGTNDGIGTAQALFNNPAGVAVDSAGNVYIADNGNDTIRKVIPVDGMWVVTTIAGKAGLAGSADGTNTSARFQSPAGIAVDGAGNLYVAEFGNHTIRMLVPAGTNWVVSTIAGKAGVAGSADGTNRTARFKAPMELALDANGNVYVADSGNDTIRMLAPAGTNWVVTTLAGKAGAAGSANGTGNPVRFNTPYGVALDSAGTVYVADTLNDTIRQGQRNIGSTLSVIANPANGGTVSGSGAYLVGTPVKIIAHANTGWTFTGWSDGGAPTHTLTVPATNTTVTATFLQQTVATPLITPATGTYTNSVTVTLKCATAGTTIRYTMDGSNPTTTSTAYKKAFTLTNSVTVNAQAFKTTMLASAVMSVEFTVVPPSPLVISTTSLPEGQHKTTYSSALNAAGGVPPYKWSLVSGKLPAGLALNAAKGVITGKPTKSTATPAIFTVQVSDSRKQTHQQSFTLTVN